MLLVQIHLNLIPRQAAAGRSKSTLMQHYITSACFWDNGTPDLECNMICLVTSITNWHRWHVSGVGVGWTLRKMNSQQKSEFPSLAGSGWFPFVSPDITGDTMPIDLLYWCGLIWPILDLTLMSCTHSTTWLEPDCMRLNWPFWDQFKPYWFVSFTLHNVWQHSIIICGQEMEVKLSTTVITFNY